MKTKNKLEIKPEKLEENSPPIQESELEHLHALYKELQERNIRSIGDLENQIARLQK